MTSFVRRWFRCAAAARRADACHPAAQPHVNWQGELAAPPLSENSKAHHLTGIV
jgi:hypothetical protein